MLDLGMSGYQIIGGVAGGYSGDAPRDEKTQVEETSNTLLLEWVAPVWCEVVAFGVAIVEDFEAHATDPVVSLKKANTVGGTETVIKALTLGSSNTRLAKGDGNGPGETTGAKYPKDNVTAIAADTDLDTGDMVYADLSEAADDGVSRVLQPGQVLIFEHTTAAGEAGGAYVPFAIVKLSGPELTRTNTWREVQDGETAGSD